MSNEDRRLWCDLTTDREREEWLRSGRAYDTGIMAAAITDEIADAYMRLQSRDERIKDLENGLRELRRWVGDGDLSESVGWSDEDYTPEYRAVLRATDALLKPNAGGEQPGQIPL